MAESEAPLGAVSPRIYALIEGRGKELDPAFNTMHARLVQAGAARCWHKVLRLFTSVACSVYGVRTRADGDLFGAPRGGMGHTSGLGAGGERHALRPLSQRVLQLAGARFGYCSHAEVMLSIHARAQVNLKLFDLESDRESMRQEVGDEVRLSYR